MRKIIVTILACLLLGIVFLGSCENGYDCSLDNIAYNRIGFYNTNEYGIEERYQFPDPLTVALVVNGRDSIVVNNRHAVESLQLPMNHTSLRDTIILDYGNDITDTLYVEHENRPFYISMECGTVMYHKLTGITHTSNFIDSAVIVNDQVKFNYNENIKLYLVD